MTSCTLHKIELNELLCSIYSRNQGKVESILYIVRRHVLTVAYLLMAIAGSNVESSAADRAMQGCEAPLHVQGKASQQQLVQDLVVAMAGCQVAGGHALVVVAGHLAASYDQLGNHLQVASL